ncbi:tetratricopeptide repeat protein [Thermomicrobium sp. 4228-Ro]|uniref:tetratricopeptide repeat protein n=1 Tax=Thermomicrobium sp. 4228-Ro TaxID=2993937 RepID=UPI0022487816|nr:tetratricopeptide repeat protein [Thermomicrobium sp. 4228-Ro]MCX2726918.1 tetratricopeptide repeat protein [Thermomicrobium sp. 4228-Ro]
MSAIPLGEAVERAQRAIGEGRLDVAKAIVEAIRSAAPEAAITQRLWSQVLLEEDAETAERVLVRAVEIDPEDADAWALLAETRRRQGDRDAARRLLQVAWESAPWRREFAERLLEWYREDGQDGQLWLSRAGLSAVYVAQGWWTRAGEECRAVLEVTSERWDLRQRLCLALWWLGAREEAAAEAERLLAERPEMVGALIVATLAARERGDESTARRHRELLWTLDPVGESIARCVPVERWEERAWLRAPEQVLVEERWTVASLGVTALLWDLPTDEELEAARPSGQPIEEEALGVEMLTLAEEMAGESESHAGEFASEVAEEAPAGGETLWELPSDEEIEAARPASELERGWTSLLEELGASGVEPLVIEEAGEGPPVSAVVERASETPGEEAVSAEAGTWLTAGRGAEEGGVGQVERLAGTEDVEAARIGSTAGETEHWEPSAPAVSGVSDRTAGAEVEVGSIVVEFERLLASGAVGEAVRLAQRVVHRGGEDAEALVPQLERLVAEGGPGSRQAAMALGAFYRRRGETGRAARYYELALRLRGE